ncbi:tyrosine-protein kinase receptor [Nesidiocoris tenuis]|nr:tyrosine-protein kinase receptor [Nesidiocoris tenuis]
MAAAKTCHSMDVRNHVNNIKQLEGCHVIEGFLQVVLIDNAKEEHFANYTFPELREVTEYVIFFRVNGLRSIRSIFPNLSVIRGEQLAMDYALIINELPQLQEINLPSLVIIRGAVSLGKNQRLCFANTIDWDQVAADSSSHLIFSNGDVNCPRCGHCPNNRCWNSTTCQVQLEWKSPEGEECDKQCLGGCKGRGPKNCTACKHVNYKGTCIKFCPPDTYVYKLRYCISAGECANPNFHPNRTRHPAGDVREWFTFNRTCIQECPYGYERVLDKGCQPCGGMCKKVCSQTVVDSLQSAQSLRDCTFINGSLAIQISSGKSSVVAKELENNLGKIEEIVGYLKIARSYPLVDLNFLKNLRIIHGKSTFDESPFHDPSRSFIVIDNQNLQDIWDWDSRPPNSTFEIRRGRPFFHHNPKLCLKHIYRLMNSTGLKNLTDIEVARNSNGDQFACHVLNLSVSVHLKYSNSVVLVINPPSQMTFIRYIAYYKKATINMTTPHGDDECGDNGWNMNDVLDSYGSSDNMNRSVYHSINRLEPDTLYAFYVATYTVDSMGAESSLQHFRTLPSMPDMPTKFMVHSNSSSEIVLRWDPPLKPNGQIKKYILTGFLTTEYSSLLENRNYCEQPVKAVVQTTPPPKIETFMKPSDDCCDLEEKRMKQSLLICEARDKSLPKIPLKIANDCDQYWYDLVANRTIPAAVSSYREKSQRIVKRSAVIAAEAHLFNARDVSSLNESEVYQDNKLVSFVRIFDENVQEVSIRDLKHYSSYGVTVTACRERVPEEPLDVKVCSQYSIEYALTLPDPSADDVVDGLSVVVYNRTARLSWKKPIANGVTVSYHVELLRTDVANAVPQVTCVPATMADGTYELHDLPLGDFRVRLKSLSLADSGKYTDPVEFSIIEYSFKSIAIVVIVILILLITIGTGVGGYYFYKTKSIPHPILITSINPEYCGVPFDDEWEIPREKIKIIKELKRGNFGIVCEGVLLPENTTVAVKKVIESASSRDVATFMNEALVMKRFTNCHHIVRLIGVVSKDYPQLVIMEMMAKGDLKSFLRESRDNTPPSPAQMCLMAAQIADGMAYLEAEKFVHRDLAARNCMVTIDNVVKIGDFGMTRDVYETDYYRKGSRGLLPVRWMAPESLNDGVFSTKSDVWSYGVVLWEMITLASQPYQGMSNEQVLQYVVSGNKLDLPPVYPKRFKAIMFWCWKWKPKFRPSFIQILMEFEDYMTLHFRHTAYYYTPEGIQAKEATLSAEQEDVEILENNTRTRFSRTNGQTAANS